MKHTLRTASLFARDSLVSVLVAAIALGPATPAFAGPQGDVVRRGSATITRTGDTTWTITASDGSIIEYSSFDIALRESVRFIQPGADARVLNRILGDAPTRIDGQLSGNGHIYIVNPAGVFFGEGSQVNVNGLHAAAGRISNDDFAAGTDRFTGVSGNVTNAGQIAGCEGLGDGCAVAARAVSLVGEEVVNSGQVIAEDGWIVIAAGNDVLIGRDDAGGPLLRIEGGAGAIFDESATGVTNTGTIEATGTTASTGVVRVGAGDLYGTAIFSNQAIRARELALAAGNRGDIALGGEVSAEKLDISFRGTTAVGELQSAVAGETTTLRADELKLSASGSAQQIAVSDDVAFRSQDDDALGPNKVTLEQTATLSSSRLETLDIGDVAAGATRDLALRSTAGNVVIDNKAIVTDTNLALSGTLADIRGTDALNVASLAVTGTSATAGGNVTSAGDIVASTGGISVQGNLNLITKPHASGDPAIDSVVSAHGGTLDIDGNITTSAGGPLRIEARNVDLGKLNDDDVAVGGVITSQGDVTIGFTDADGVQQTQNVKLQTIDTRGATGAEGGNVDVAASGDVTIATIVTNGGAGSSTSQPNRDGGSVSVRAGDAGTLEIGSVATGGAGAADRAGIDLAGGTVVLNSGIDATAANQADGARSRDGARHGCGGEISSANSLAGPAATSASTARSRRGRGSRPGRPRHAGSIAISASGTTRLLSRLKSYRSRAGGPVVPAPSTPTRQ
jgi:filamentous hemagglutinin family protein